MSGAPFPWTFDQRFAADSSAPDATPNVATTRESGAATAATYDTGTAEAVTREAGETA